jgi:hypothetical protein
MRRKQLQKGFSLMRRHLHRASLWAALALLAVPATGFAFDAVDILTPASSGLYPAYPSEPIPPYALWAQAGAMYDTNILRRTVGDNSEFLTRLGLGGRYDQRVVGRQAVHLEGRLDGYVYNKFGELDNLAYAGIGEYRYEIGNDFAGAFGVQRRHYQANLSEIQRAQFDPITETDFTANGRYALGPHVGLRAGATYIDYVRPSRPFSNTKTTIGTAGIDYVSDLGNTVGLEFAEAKGNAPVNQLVDPLGLFVNNDYTQRDIGVVGNFGVAPTMRVAGRVGRTQRQYTELPGRDFNGPTWDVLVQWYPTPKTVLVFETAKTVSSIIDVGASHITSKGFSFGPGWAVTAKLNVQARFYRQHQVFEGDPQAILGVTPLREEFVRGYRLGTYWDYDRHISYQFALDHGERESNILGRNFVYNAGIAQVRYVF